MQQVRHGWQRRTSTARKDLDDEHREGEAGLKGDKDNIILNAFDIISSEKKQIINFTILKTSFLLKIISSPLHCNREDLTLCQCLLLGFSILLLSELFSSNRRSFMPKLFKFDDHEIIHVLVWINSLCLSLEY